VYCFKYQSGEGSYDPSVDLELDVDLNYNTDQRNGVFNHFNQMNNSVNIVTYHVILHVQ